MEKDKREVASQPVSKGLSPKSPRQSGDEADQEEQSVNATGSEDHSPEVYIQGKVFNDSVHGHIEVHPLCVKIIDTPQFQRLRNIKQLGGCYHVFPGASHNRFEHSIGTCHLAGELVRGLQKRQPKLRITNAEILCVEIAGLCHDLGHGPFSHLFDALFIPEARPKKWKHEDASLTMFDHMVEVNDLLPSFKKYNLTEKDVIFIKELIAGTALDRDGNQVTKTEDYRIKKGSLKVFVMLPVYLWQKRPFKGRESDKMFLYEIVANKRTGIDVDKFDYFSRDCHNLGIRNNFDHKRYMKFARVINVDGKPQICVRDKEAENLYDMFHTRRSLHQRAYQHKTKNIIEKMTYLSSNSREIVFDLKLTFNLVKQADNWLTPNAKAGGKSSFCVQNLFICLFSVHRITEALVKADKEIKLKGTDGKMLSISESIDDMQAYTQLTDHVYHQILYSDAAKLKEARAILQRIEKRDLYKCIGQKVLKKPRSKEEIREEIFNFWQDGPHITPDDFIVEIVTFNYGMRDKNPLEELRFYPKNAPDEPIILRKDEVSKMLPEKFSEQSLRVYFRRTEPDCLEKAKR
ncbi:deoxynucleoside triphosphate triphosphohydrolase SAMHD1-like [Acropora millepora]|uniref:deoxynucleoside triphosphate triphosphohydrolase SAMHD1-like n=1 Tax=Acropora millepora TaxID=45264 RepID=UPI001CF41DBD|nr:deoxynucleoside triphosphate triphosphohydrolase SAMHD1-like [Acropora millepora]